MENFYNKEKIELLSKIINNNLSEEYIENNKDKLSWGLISLYQVLSEDLINKYEDRINFDNLSNNKKISLSESFIEKYKDRLNWTFISAYQVLSESFIEKHIDKIDWNGISNYQKLSKRFIEKYKDKINLSLLKQNVLTQTNIEKEWFITYINRTDSYFNRYKLLNYYNNSLDDRIDCIKVRIFYKNLINTISARKVDFLRENNSINKFKIKGKN